MIKLTISGVGHIKGLKNNKFLARGRLLTKPESHLQMKKIVRSLELQLLSSFQISENATLLTPKQLLKIVSNVPLDDCWTEVGDINLIAHKVNKGEEGAEIYIERIDN